MFTTYPSLERESEMSLLIQRGRGKPRPQTPEISKNSKFKPPSPNRKITANEMMNSTKKNISLGVGEF
jgi:hypothetical protein